MKISLRKKLLTYTVGLNLLITCTLAFAIYHTSYKIFFDSFMQSKLSFARSVALAIDGDKHQLFNTLEAKKDKEYQRYLKYFNTIKTTEQFITYLYTMNYDSVGKRFLYAIDGDIAQENIFWIESEKMTLELHILPEKQWFVHKQVEYSDGFSTDIDNQEVKVLLKNEGKSKILYFDKTKIATITLNPFLLQLTESSLDSVTRYIEGNYNLHGKSVSAVYSLSLKGEAASDPGTPAADNTETMRIFMKNYLLGTDVIDSAFVEGNYGKSISAYAMIRNSKGQLAGMVCVDMFERELTQFKKSVTKISAIITAVSILILLIVMPLVIEFLIIRNIKKLKIGVEKIAKSELEERIVINSGDEFQVLAEGFNQMAENLQLFYNNLKDEIAISKSLHLNIKSPFFETDTDGLITYINSEALKISGLPLDHVRYVKQAYEIFGNSDVWQKTWEGERFLNYESHIINYLHQEIPVIINSGQIRNSKNDIIGIFVMYTDLSEISELKELNRQISESYQEIMQQNAVILEQKEELLQQNEEINVQKEQLELTNRELEKLSIAASETDNVIIIAHADGTFEWINQGFTKLFGVNLEKLQHDGNANLFAEMNSEYARNKISECRETKQTVTYHQETQDVAQNTIWLQTTVTPILDEDDKLLRFVAVSSDITKNKLAEQEIKKQNREIERKNANIMQSIAYAKRIQGAILPSTENFERIFADRFIFYKPRDIVSGDFYFFKRVDYYLFIAAADCTGHGVPGAFMSMLGITLLNEIIQSTQNYHVGSMPNAALLLAELREKVKSVLNQTGKMGEQQDGMDIAFCIYDIETKQLSYSGAHNPLLLIRNNELIEYKADRMPVSVFRNERAFTEHKLTVETNDTIYLYTDGYYSQFGGKDGNTMKSKPFKQFLLDIHQKPMSEQLDLLQNEFDKWRGRYEQIDDVLVMGVRV